MLFTAKIRTVGVMLIVASCATTNPDLLSSNYSETDTLSLWAAHQISTSPLDLAFIEAELGARGQTHSGNNYLGNRTASAMGRATYPRGETVSAGQDCGDFSSPASAQKYFLVNGGPISDPHNLDGDGDGLACEWGTYIGRVARMHSTPPVHSRPSRSYASSSYCHVGPRGGRYTINSNGTKDYGGC